MVHYNFRMAETCAIPQVQYGYDSARVLFKRNFPSQQLLIINNGSMMGDHKIQKRGLDLHGVFFGEEKEGVVVSSSWRSIVHVQHRT